MGKEELAKENCLLDRWGGSGEGGSKVISYFTSPFFVLDCQEKKGGAATPISVSVCYCLGHSAQSAALKTRLVLFPHPPKGRPLWAPRNSGRRGNGRF